MSNVEITHTVNNNHIRTSIAPWLLVGDMIKAVTFYQAAFGASEAYRLESPDRQLQVIKLSVDAAEFWLSQQPQDAFESERSASIKFILTVSNPDIVFEQALKAGASQIFPVGEEHGWRLGKIADPFGYHWEIGRPVSA